MNKRQKFIEPELVKCEESLEKITLCYSNYQGDNNDYEWKPKKHFRRRWWHH